MPPHAIHGVAYDRPWTVTGPGEITLDLDARWPFRGRLVQAVTVDRDSLEVRMRLEAGERRYDIGNFNAYFRAFVEFALADPRFGAPLRRYLEDLLHVPRP